MNKLIVHKHPSKKLIGLNKIVSSNEALVLAKHMLYAYETIPCAGIAAPQLGINRMIFVAQGKVYINPVITKKEGVTKEFLEGCLSLARHQLVPRYDSVTLKWNDIEGIQYESIFTGYSAEVIQHEYDHLLGKLLIDYIPEQKPDYNEPVYHYSDQSGRALY